MMNNHLLLFVIITSYTTFLPFSTSFTLIQLRRQQNRVRSNYYDVVLSMKSNTSNNNNNNEKKVSDELYFPNSQKVTSSSSSNINHISILKKQLGGQTNPGDAAIEVPSCTMCQHGYPQVFGMNPFVDPASSANGDGSNDGGGSVRKKKTQRLNSSLLKLTCPLLVKAIDEMEDDGYIESHFNPQLQMIDTSEDNNNNDNDEMIKMKNQRVEQLRKALKESHELHAQVRNKIVYSDISGKDNIQLLNSKLGRQQQERLTSTNNDNNNIINITEIFLNSGIAGIANNTKQMNTDVKCLHAWLADYLFFGNTDSNENKKKNHFHWIGTQIEQILLNEYGISLNGSSNCKCMCDPSFEALDQEVQLKDSFLAAPKPRNKQRKRTRKEIARRKRKRHHEQLL